MREYRRGDNPNRDAWQDAKLKEEEIDRLRDELRKICQDGERCCLCGRKSRGNKR